MTTTTADPIATDPDLYTVAFENERVRVLEYRDRPGHALFVELKG